MQHMNISDPLDGDTLAAISHDLERAHRELPAGDSETLERLWDEVKKHPVGSNVTLFQEQLRNALLLKGEKFAA